MVCISLFTHIFIHLIYHSYINICISIDSPFRMSPYGPVCDNKGHVFPYILPYIPRYTPISLHSYPLALLNIIFHLMYHFPMSHYHECIKLNTPARPRPPDPPRIAAGSPRIAARTPPLLGPYLIGALPSWGPT